MRRLKHRLTFANVTAGLALFIALGGTSYAAITLPRNSVGANQLRTGSVRSAEIKDRTIGARDLTLGARRFLKGQKGEQGERGPVGPAGTAGTSGTSGTTGTTAAGITTTTVTAMGRTPAAPDAESQSSADATATCPSGRATGGGVRATSAANQVVISSFPVGGNAWQAEVGNYSTTAYDFTVYVICAS